MIITNGYIRFKEKISSGIDLNSGYPTPPSYIWGEEIPCQYIINSYDNLGVVKGEHFVKASYYILVEQPLNRTSEQLCLTNLRGEQLGEFSVISVEDLNAVNQVKILV